jgi:hypothetical protein
MTIGFIPLPDNVVPASAIHDGAVGERQLSDGRVIVLYPMIYTWRLCLGAADDRFGYDHAWCYPADAFEAAICALSSWNGDGDPTGGWTKHVGS